MTNGGELKHFPLSMDEKDCGQITEPKENVTGELPHVPDEYVDT